MTRNGVALFVGLGLIGAVSGFVLGELSLGSGRGLTVAPLSALVGLLLAAALWKTRPRTVGAVPPPAPVAPLRRGQRPTGRNVRVAKAQQDAKPAQPPQPGRSQSGRPKQGRKKR